jgi:hypothetical protein
MVTVTPVYFSGIFDNGYGFLGTNWHTPLASDALRIIGHYLGISVD